MKLTDRKRESILAAAIAEFQQEGFLGARTSRIAQRAEVSSRTLYKHFESKEVLFTAVTEELLQRNVAIPAVAYDPALPLDRQLIAALDAYVLTITEPEFMGLSRLVISEFLRDLERSRGFFSKLAQHDYPVTGLIAEAMEAGALRKADPVYAAGQLLALVKNFFFWPEFLLGELPEEMQPSSEVMADSVAMFLKHYEP